MRISRRRVHAILRKELREYRRHGSVLVATAIFPVIFLVQPLFVVFMVPSAGAATLEQWHLLLYMLGIPVLTPAILAAYAVAGERQQGSLEPVLTTPIRREEFLLAKALSAFIPSVLIAYGIYALFLALVVLFAQPDIAPAVIRAPDVVAQLLLTPLLACLCIWVGIAISSRTSDVRVAQQLTLLANVPVVAVTSLIAFDVIHPTPALGVGLTVILLAADVMGWWIVARLFDRERLITGTR
jgi:ABC-2 type transport system permease protein